MSRKEDTFPGCLALLLILVMYCTVYFWIPNISYCNEKVQSTIMGIRPDGDFSCFYDVSYSVGQKHYEQTVGKGCPSSQFKSAQLDLCYSHFKPSKCAPMSGNYMAFSIVMVSFSIFLTGFSFMLFIIIKHGCFEKGAIVEQVQITPV